MKNQTEQKMSDTMMLAEAICNLKGALKNYFNHTPALSFKDKNTLRQLFYDIDDFCQALYSED